MNELQIYIDRMFDSYKQTCATCLGRHRFYHSLLPRVDRYIDFPGERWYREHNELCSRFLDRRDNAKG